MRVPPEQTQTSDTVKVQETADPSQESSIFQFQRPDHFDLPADRLEDHFERYSPQKCKRMAFQFMQEEDVMMLSWREAARYWDLGKNRLKPPVTLNYSITDDLKPYISRLVKREKKNLESVLQSKRSFVLMIDQKLANRGMPQELRWIPYIESKYNEFSRSKSYAGLWQLSDETARRFGLRVTDTHDERYDPERSTDAALDTLEYLYEKLDCWLLAMAAYNAGEGRIRDAILQTNTRDFYLLAESETIPEITRNYVFSILALQHIFTHHVNYGIQIDN